MDFFRYWWLVLKRAAADTMAYFPFQQRPIAAAVHSVIVLVSIGILYFIAGPASAVGNINNTVAVVAAFAVVIGILFFLYLSNAPYRIHSEQKAKLKDIEGKMRDTRRRRGAAAPLREKIVEIDELLAQPGSTARPSPPLIVDSARKWETAVLEIMRDHEVSETEIHMFETIAQLPFPGRQRLPMTYRVKGRAESRAT